jgi:hypothetical protein
MHQLLEHAGRAELQRFSANSKSRKVIVSHARVDFVSLNVVFMGSSSAVGVAMRNSSKIGRQNSVRAPRNEPL